MYYSEKTPDENGWYWVRFVDEHGDGTMCHWNPEDDEPVLLAPSREKRRLVPRSIVEVAAWIGPLASPFGDFACDHAYFAEDQYLRARDADQDAVLVHVDSSQTERRLGTVTNTGMLDHIDAMTRTAEVFRV